MIVKSAFSAFSARHQSPRKQNSEFSALSARVFPSFSLLIRVFRVFRCSIIESLLVIEEWKLITKKFTPNLLVNLLRIS